MSAHRKATLRELARAVITRESIRTTRVKAKVAQSFVDTLITRARVNTPESKREIFALLRDKEIIELLFNDVAPRFKERKGGYTRVIPLYPRRGDGSPMAILELVEKRPPKEPKKAKKAPSKAQAAPKAATPPKAEEAPKKDEPKKAEKKVAVQEPPKAKPPKVEKAKIDQEIKKEKAKDEDKKIKKGGLFNNIQKYFRGKKP